MGSGTSCPSSAGAMTARQTAARVAKLEAQLEAQAAELTLLRANAKTEEPATAPIDSYVELPLSDADRARARADLTAVTAAIAALQGVPAAQVMSAELESQAALLRRQLHRSKPLDARKEALEEALKRRRSNQVTLQSDYDKAEAAMEVANASLGKVAAEIVQLESDLAALNVMIEATVPSSPEAMLREILAARSQGNVLSSSWYQAASCALDGTMDVAQPVSLATPRGELDVDSRVPLGGDLNAAHGSRLSKDPLWSALRADTTQARHRPY